MAIGTAPATFNVTNPVVVGDATKKSHYDRVFRNALALKQGDIARDMERLCVRGAGEVPPVVGATEAGLYFDDVLDEVMISRQGAPWEPFGGGAGSIINVAQMETTTYVTTTSAAWTNTPITLPYTVKRDGSTLYICYAIGGPVVSFNTAGAYELRRDGVQVAPIVTMNAAQEGIGSSGILTALGSTIRDPAALAKGATVTYTVAYRRVAGSGVAAVNYGNDLARSSLMVLEVAG